jgi:hypothetical protein
MIKGEAKGPKKPSLLVTRSAAAAEANAVFLQVLHSVQATPLTCFNANYPHSSAHTKPTPEPTHITKSVVGIQKHPASFLSPLNSCLILSQNGRSPQH